MSPHQDSYNSKGPASPQGGFTLIEALVALVLLTVGLIPAFTLASSSLTLAGSIQNSLVATHLAQEGVEVVRAIRDADWFAGNSFGKSLDSCTSPDATIKCRVQYDSTSTTLLPSSGIPPALKKDPDTGLFQYTKGADTLYHREVIITKVS